MRRRSLFVALLTAAQLPASAASAQLGEPSFARLSVKALFGNSAYTETLAGDVHVSWSHSADGTAVVSWPIGIGRQPCRTSLSWRVPDAEKIRATAPVPVCVVSGGATDDSVTRWTRGRATAQEDPTLGLELAPVDGGWANQAPISAGLVMGRCHAGEPDLTRYGDLLLPAGAVRLSFTDAGDVRISVAEGSVDNVRAAAWDDVRRRCGNGNAELPQPATTRLTGPATAALADQGRNASDLVRRLVDTIVELTYTGHIARKEAVSLVGSLDAGEESLAVGDVAGAGKSLDDFEFQLRQKEMLGLVDQKTGLRLRFAVTSVRDQIAFELLPLPAALCTDPPQCTYHVYYVDSGFVHGRRDGTELRPFRTISDAVEAATASGACGVEIRVRGPSAYREAVTIVLPTRIVGIGSARPALAGNIVNQTGSALEIRDLEITNSRDPRGAIFVDHRCASTSLDGVLIERPSNFGVYQRGGSLESFALTVRRTTAAPGDPRNGTGIVVRDATAYFGLSSSEFNASGGLYAEGAQASVRTGLFGVIGNDVNPSLRPDSFEECGAEAARGFGGVVASDGAHVDLRYSVITDNRGIGLVATRDAVVDAFGTQVVNNRAISETGLCPFGHGVVAISRGHVRLSNFEISHSYLCGLVIRDAQMDARNGLVSDGAIGGCISVPDYDLSRVLDDVMFRRNGVNLELVTMEVPDPTQPPDF